MKLLDVQSAAFLNILCNIEMGNELLRLCRLSTPRVRLEHIRLCFGRSIAECSQAVCTEFSFVSVYSIFCFMVDGTHSIDMAFGAVTFGGGNRYIMLVAQLLHIPLQAVRRDAAHLYTTSTGKFARGKVQFQQSCSLFCILTKHFKEIAYLKQYDTVCVRRIQFNGIIVVRCVNRRLLLLCVRLEHIILRSALNIRHYLLNKWIAIQFFRFDYFTINNAVPCKRFAHLCRVNIREIIVLHNIHLRFGSVQCSKALHFITLLFLRCQIAVLTNERTNLVIDLAPRQCYLIVDTIGITAFKGNALMIMIFAVTAISATARTIFIFQKFDAFFLCMVFCIKLGNTLFAAIYTAAAAQHFVDLVLRDKGCTRRFKAVCGSIERCHALSTLQTFCRIFGTLHIEAKAAKITVSLHSACVVRHFTGQYGALCRVAQCCGQLLNSRRENIVSKFLCLRKKALLPRFFAHIVIGVPDF